MSFGTGKTTLVNDLILGCDNIEDFRNEILKNLTSQKQLWVKKINEILTENDYSQSRLAALCEVSRATVLKWVRGSIPQSRDMFIRIGLAAHYDLDEMNMFLKRYGRYPELYSKSLEDSVYIFVLNSKTIDHTYEACKTVFERVDLSVLPKDTSVKRNSVHIDSQLFTGYILNIESIPQLKDFIAENAEEFKNSFALFYEYVKNYVQENNASYQEFDEDINLNSVNLLAETLGWSSSLKKCVYSIFNGDWIPRRNKVISLGLHLNMNVDEINELLHLAKMEKLYPINPTEGLIIYAVSDAELNDMIFPGTDDLYEHVLGIFDELTDDSPDFSLEDFLGDNQV